MANIEGTSVPRSTACDGQRDRFGNKGSILEGRLSILSRPKPHNGTQTMECFEISGPAAFLSYEYTEINTIQNDINII